MSFSARGVAATMVILWSVPLFAAEARSLSDEVTKLLDIGWAPSHKAQAAAQKQYEIARAMAPGDRRVQIAFALVQLRQRRYTDAWKMFGEIAASDENNLTAWRARVWLTMLTKNYEQAIVELENLSQLLPEQEAEGDQESEYREIATFMGRMFGFLQGPAADTVSESIRRDAKQKIVDRLTDARRLAFLDGDRGVRQKYSMLAVEQDETKVNEKESQIKRKADLKDEIARTRDDISAKREQIAARRDKLRDEVRSSMELLGSEEAPLIESYARLDSSAGAIKREMFLVNSDIVRQAQLANNETDPFRKQQYEMEIGRLQRILFRYDADLSRLRIDAAAIGARRADIQRRRAQLNSRTQNELIDMDKQLRGLEKSSDRLNVRKRKLNRSTTGTTSRVLAIAAQAKGLKTYDQFPIEQAKNDLLDSFK